ncbi:hypothetical protein [Nonomuraea angiospora]|uniref:hypothetical protein n=1 Tax=Nonomuraea angiospora TaxID=46172 RepID=UPI0029B96DBC|nr:hypothetical protein [Nonomuraea angiospora]MDX3110155.1 hypothetical protein [Nonomuraea angiospora]
MDTVVRIELWTVDDAVRELHPEMTVEQVRALVALAGLQPIGKRPPGPYGGRPAKVYDGEQLRRAHAVIAPLLIAA